MKKLWNRIVPLGLILVLALQISAFAGEIQTETENPAAAMSVEEIVSGMTLDEKISQMLISSIQTWNGEIVTDLEAEEGLSDALRRHQYGGVFLLGNVTGTAQAARLVRNLQENNAGMEDVTVNIPYFIPIDQEGGVVARLGSGCRMTGSMAVGATGEAALENAEKTGQIFGEELQALGINVDFAPVIDVNNNAANPVIGTRSFSDDPDIVAQMGLAFAEGLSKSNVIATFKHFPGHGDTATDSHIGTPSISKTYEELQEIELVPYKAAIEAGADMIMTAHITFPQIDEEVTFGDGVTKGYYPATMSEKMITEILRQDLGYDGLVVTDSIKMGAIRDAGLVPGEKDSTEYWIHIAEKVINAGVDLILVPTDLCNEEAVAFYDEYIGGLSDLVEDGTIPVERIDESVTRILKTKEKYQILNAEDTRSEEEMIADAQQVVGCAAHHDTEMEIARSAITLVKNDNQALQAARSARKIVLLYRGEGDRATVEYAASALQEEGFLPEDAEITYAYYYDANAEPDQMLHYTDEMRAAIKDADLVVGISTVFSFSAIADGAPQYEGIHSAIEDTHAGGGTFILLSNNLPYDAARYQEADAIVLAYMSTGLNLDPTERSADTSEGNAYNANAIAAFETIFGKNEPSGILPVNIPVLETGADGTLTCGDSLLYERGFGLTQ